MIWRRQHLQPSLMRPAVSVVERAPEEPLNLKLLEIPEPPPRLLRLQPRWMKMAPMISKALLLYCHFIVLKYEFDQGFGVGFCRCRVIPWDSDDQIEPLDAGHKTVVWYYYLYNQYTQSALHHDNDNNSDFYYHICFSIASHLLPCHHTAVRVLTMLIEFWQL